MAFTQVTVTQAFTTAKGDAAAGTVTFTPTAAMRNGGIVVARAVSASIVAGSMTIVLAATDDVGTTPVGVGYRVDEDINGSGLLKAVRRTYYITLPAADTSVTLAELAIAETPSPVLTTYLTQAAADARYLPRAAALAMILGG